MFSSVINTFINKTLVLFIWILPYLSTSQHSLVKYDFPINTETYDEISPVVSYDEKKIFITRIGSPDFERTLLIDSTDVFQVYDEKEYNEVLKKVYKQIASKEISEVIHSPYNQDVWVVHLGEDQKPVDLTHPAYPLNDALPNSICARYDNHDRFILINQFEKTGGLDKGFSVTKMTPLGFTFPEPIHVEGFTVKSANVNITSSSDQKILILSMPDPDGNMDLYVTHRIYDVHYAKPEKLNAGINTAYDEMTPFLSKDMQTLYFASNRPGTLGGTDIFKATRLDDSFKNWGQIETFHPPLNSPGDELYPCLFDKEKKLLFSSNRDGSHDIFQTSLIRDENIEIDIEVFIINGASQKTMPGELYWGLAYMPDGGRENYFRCRDGKYTIKIRENKPQKIQAENRNLKSQEVWFDPQEIYAMSGGKAIFHLILEPEKSEIQMTQKATIEVLPFEQILEKKEWPEKESSSAVFKNIMFEKSKAVILDRSLPTIFTLGKCLKMNKEMKIEISGHTDNVGDETALQKLSYDRANAIKDQLIKQGISADRIVTLGLGSSKPVSDNDTETSRKLNRRVEVRIIKEKTQDQSM